jgi:hypothetical protein
VERNAQVRLMGRVYEQACCVRTSLVFDFGGKDILAETLNCLKSQELRKAGFLQNHGNAFLPRKIGNEPPNFPRVQESPYWKRACVQQEVRLGKDHRVHVDHAEIEPWQLASILFNFSDNVTHPHKQSLAMLVQNIATASNHSILDALALVAMKPRILEIMCTVCLV